MSTGKKIWAYRRENGRVGVRNHVVILPLDDLSNAAAEAVAHAIKGTLTNAPPAPTKPDSMPMRPPMPNCPTKPGIWREGLGFLSMYIWKAE